MITAERIELGAYSNLDFTQASREIIALALQRVKDYGFTKLDTYVFLSYLSGVQPIKLLLDAHHVASPAIASYEPKGPDIPAFLKPRVVRDNELGMSDQMHGVLSKATDIARKEDRLEVMPLDLWRGLIETKDAASAVFLNLQLDRKTLAREAAICQETLRLLQI